jgi:acetylornithine deacetylase/succinyl-diaminopimelate desuccinylase-like protein/beta-lactamase class A
MRSLFLAAAAVVLSVQPFHSASNPLAAARTEILGLIDRAGADVSVAFRTLDGTAELLYRPDIEFHAASTMKVPVLIELFKQARANRLKLDDQVPVVNEFHSIVDGSPYQLSVGDDSDADVYKHVGGTMSYRDLAEAMITVSSNFATNLLIERLGARNIQATVNALGAPGMHVLRGVEDDKAFEKGLNNTTTSRALMTLMERIATGQAVDRSASDEMAAILKRQKFNSRIPAGVPPGVAVAHKTGEITKIQHDAAIVYAERPFVLVVLVRGLEDPKAGSALAADITRVLYNATQRQPATAAKPAAASATTDLLVDLIRFNTSNPPGKEGQIAEFLAPKFKALGFDVEIVPTPEAGKAHFFARLKGDGSRKPVLLAAHSDVVGVEREKWTIDPFAGTIKDGHVYGRGAIDFKGGLAVFARAAMMLAENKVPLARDVILLVEADEEGAPYNTSWLARTHWDRMDAEFALNEGGWIIKDDAGKVKYVSISTADKSAVAVVLTARGTSTHSSMPRPDNAIFTLGRALAKLADYETKIELTPATRQFFATLAKTSAGPIADSFKAIADGTDPAAMARADAEVSKDPLLHALIRNTIAPVLMNAGFRSNVIPGSAEVTINVRTIPGTDLNKLTEDVMRVIADPRVEVKLSNPAAAAGFGSIAPSPLDTDLYRALENASRATFPGVEVTPYLFQAGTDAFAWRSRGVPVYGIYPYPISADELTRMHGNDEKVSVESLQQGTDLIYKTLLAVAAKR